METSAIVIIVLVALVIIIFLVIRNVKDERDTNPELTDELRKKKNEGKNIS